MKTTVRVEWKDLKFGAKETTVSLIIKGDPSDEQILTLTKLKAAGMGYATLATEQMDIDDYDEDDNDHEGIAYTVENDGTVDVDPGQISIEDIETDADNDDALPESDKVTDLASKRQQKAQEATRTDDKPMSKDDDDLPF